MKRLILAGVAVCVVAALAVTVVQAQAERPLLRDPKAYLLGGLMADDALAFDPFTLSAVPSSARKATPVATVRRPEIRVPYRPVLRSPFRPPLF